MKTLLCCLLLSLPLAAQEGSAALTRTIPSAPTPDQKAELWKIAFKFSQAEKDLKDIQASIAKFEAHIEDLKKSRSDALANIDKAGLEPELLRALTSLWPDVPPRPDKTDPPAK